MTEMLERLGSGFVWQFLAGMAVNLQIAGIALLIGLAVGLPLAQARLAGGIANLVSRPLVALMRAAPTFVVMFFLMNSVPRDAALWGYPVAPSGFLAVAISLVPYSAAYVADNGAEALLNLRRGSPLSALLFLPNLTRAFLVLVMSSSAGAAIGVTEAIAVILREAELLTSMRDKLLLFTFGIACFGVPLQVGFLLVNLLHRRLSRAHGSTRQV
jgi:ABC-type amino acid transport system permease subunit